jgi:hypothetical protein
MLTIEKVDTSNKKQVKRFVEFPYQLYKDCPQWVPPLFVDAYLPLNRKKHPFFGHSEADFFLAVRDGKVVGRICAGVNKPFNEYHKTKKAQFSFFESVDDQEVANALFDAVFDWAKARGLDMLIGPKGLSPFDGYGIQVLGFEHRQMMTMMNYNYAYYPKLVEALGFEKEVDFVSCYLPSDAFKIPERVERVARRVLERGNLWVKKFRNKRELVEWAPRIGAAYNKAFIHNWEYYPFSAGDVQYAQGGDGRLPVCVCGCLCRAPARQGPPPALRPARPPARHEAHQNHLRQRHGHPARISGHGRQCLALLRNGKHCFQFQSVRARRDDAGR